MKLTLAFGHALSGRAGWFVAFEEEPSGSPRRTRDWAGQCGRKDAYVHGAGWTGGGRSLLSGDLSSLSHVLRSLSFLRDTLNCMGAQGRGR